jgi:enoyl-CoA hydratase/carnithine racemase
VAAYATEGVEPLSIDEVSAALADPQPGAGLVGAEGGGVIVVDLGRGSAFDAKLRARLRTFVAVLVAIAPSSPADADAFDVVVADAAAADDVAAACGRTPIAATTLAMLLRGTESLGVADALVAESAAYSALQAGPEHAAWLARRAPTGAPDDAAENPVTCDRHGDQLHLTLNRPARRNAFNAAMRDALLDGLAVAAGDSSIARVVIDGAGPGFCSGGDLAEFGTRADPASAHLLRVSRNVGRAIHELRDRVTVVAHGACIGAGVELAAFAGRVVATSDATFRLPEVAMGLLPGAGGTVSTPRRVGRQRAAWLAITGTALDAATALDWGLVDEISDRGSTL